MDDLGLIYDVVLGRNRHRKHQHRERESEQGLLLKVILIINNLYCLNETDIKWIFRRHRNGHFALSQRGSYLVELLEAMKIANSRCLDKTAIQWIFGRR